MRSFREFHVFHLSEHAHPVSRRLHFVGTSVALLMFVAALASAPGWLAWLALLQGYAFAGIGHWFFEHNQAATFRYPLYGLLREWRLWWHPLRGRQTL